jgi:hypothetical protein
VKVVFEEVVKYPVYWHLCGLCFVAILVVLDARSKRRGVLIIFCWNLIGVFFHELAHLLTGIVLFAKPTCFSLIPHRTEGGWQLGSVTFKRLNAFNSCPVGLAPLGLIAVAYFLFTNWTLWFTPTLYSTLGAYVVLFILVYNSTPSRQDLKIAFTPSSIFVYGTAAFVLYKYFTRE